MKRIVLLLACAAVAWAGDAAAELKALEAARDASTLGYVETYEAFKPRFETFARKHAGTEEALTARLWLLQQTWWKRRDGKMHANAQAIADEILKEYGDSKQLEAFVHYHYVFDRAQKERYFGWLLEHSKHDEVKAAALFGLGRMDLRAKDGEVLARARARLEQVIADYPQAAYRASTYAAVADAMLRPHSPATLAVGQPAPEIEGIDPEGKPLKLSQFRGKVVVLDFWGDW